MPLKPHPTDPDKIVYASRWYDIPQLQGVTTTQRPWVDLTEDEIENIEEKALTKQWAIRMTIAQLKECNA
ncbi:hypothetical protein UFOVP1024_36 [uncultured Caudovirales phage]|uniref:Uncharacterized protein n=1 Tax=uncultured Caudovirales phage TaxID=2100421 RepID=A0A6J5PV77_9CAUD|nr:hypothetical protein UFOVP949_15 [uncultured Caudovirales phage]CAB4179095.1 hypothetical protein UFOVP1024_36 [uncultured Caudovirales phage]